jgi:hypothetical protein
MHFSARLTSFEEVKGREGKGRERKGKERKGTVCSVEWCPVPFMKQHVTTP